MRRAIVIAAALLAGSASAQTVIDVPQGSDVFPTVGQVDCMEPVNGRRCAATYECGEQAGALWGDMASNDGSHAINAASPVATGRGCVVTVDGDAAVTWYRGYRPGGPGEAVGETQTDSAVINQPPKPLGDVRSSLWPAQTETEPASISFASRSSPSVHASAAAEISERINELRSEWLGQREKTVDWWLFATGIFLTMLSVLAVVAGYLGFKRFREIEAEAYANAKSSAESAKSSAEHEERARNLVNEILVHLDKAKSLMGSHTAQTVRENPDEVRRALEGIHASPAASVVERAFSAAVELQQRARIEESIEKWRALAITLEESDKDAAARAWFSVGYLKSDLGRYEEAVTDYGTAVQLKPDYYGAYINRSLANHEIGRYEEAVADCDMAIRLVPHYVPAHVNRGISNDQLGRHEEAIADYDTAIRLNPKVDIAYFNRGDAKAILGRHDESIADYETAINLARDTGNDVLAREAELKVEELRRLLYDDP